MVDLIPAAVLFGNPERVSPRLSPDGTQLAWIAPHDGILNVWVAPAGRDGIDWSQASVVTDDTDRGIRTFAWAHDGRHLLYQQDAGGDENWHLHDVDLQTTQRRDLTPFDGVQAQLIGMERKFPSQLLVGLNKDNPQLHDVYRLELVTGELVREVTNPGFVDWVADAELTVRAAVAPQPDGSLVLLVRDATGDSASPGSTGTGDSGTDGWRPLLTIPADDALTTAPLAFSEDGTSLLMVSSVGAETSRLVRMDVATGATEVLAGDPGADVSDVRIDPDTRQPQIVTLQRDRSEYQVLDPSVADDLQAIRALHPGDPVFIGADDADATWLVAFTNDAGPIPYFAYDRARRTGRFLFEQQPALSRYELAPMEPFSFSARDGLAIHGYATFPPGGGRSGLPTVLYVHGGPWVRDVWGYDPSAQWLANRGYLCLQVNYRGSTGYGKSFVAAGDREWGGKMHDDLIDAVSFAIAQGWSDADRVAIMGGSYGGYAALVGAAFTPEVFRCAVDIVGPSNLKTLIETIPEYWAPLIAQFHRRVGDPAEDAEFLWSRSPLSRVADIRIPLLIAQGANDPRVKQAESEQIVAALEQAGIEHEYMLFPDEGHGFAKPENRLKFYAAAEQFLAQQLGGRAEDPQAG
ncbi:MAG: S9 family peptidase [Streptosporangiaceae bacterium]|jgi:dipeptidyl aminopeptidase/acylaminoacyl peptidase